MKCCRYHNKFRYKDFDLGECGMSGKSGVTLCCPSCPDRKWYLRNQPTRPVEYYVDDIAKGITDEVPF